MSEFMNRFHPGQSNRENDDKIANAGRFSEQTIKVSVIALFTVACVAAIARTITRLHKLRRLRLDDVFLFLAILCLAGATGILYHLLPALMLQEALSIYTDIITPLDRIDSYVEYMDFLAPFFCLIWSATFAVKASFLALFWHLLQNVSISLTLFFWTVVLYCVIIWGFAVSEIFISCSFFGWDAVVKCFPPENFSTPVAMTMILAMLDIITDVMIASIPVILLRKSHMKPSQKVSLAFFLCLSLVITVFAFVRSAGLTIGVAFDSTWMVFWQYMEGVVACVMVSVTPFRKLFVNFHRWPLAHRGNNRNSSQSYRDRLWRRATAPPGPVAIMTSITGGDASKAGSTTNTMTDNKSSSTTYWNYSLPRKPLPVAFAASRSFILTGKDEDKDSVGVGGLVAQDEDSSAENRGVSASATSPILTPGQIHVRNSIDIESTRGSFHSNKHAEHGANFV